MPTPDDDTARVASDGYYGDDSDDLPGEYDRVLISHTDGMFYDFEAVATDDGRIRITRQDHADR